MLFRSTLSRGAATRTTARAAQRMSHKALAKIGSDPSPPAGMRPARNSQARRLLVHYQHLDNHNWDRTRAPRRTRRKVGARGPRGVPAVALGAWTGLTPPPQGRGLTRRGERPRCWPQEGGGDVLVVRVVKVDEDVLRPAGRASPSRCGSGRPMRGRAVGQKMTTPEASRALFSWWR